MFNNNNDNKGQVTQSANLFNTSNSGEVNTGNGGIFSSQK